MPPSRADLAPQPACARPSHCAKLTCGWLGREADKRHLECDNRTSWPVSRVLFTRRTAFDDHSSGTPVAGRLMQPTRTAARKPAWSRWLRAVPIWFCSRWGLPCRPCCQRRGALLPHPFTLTPDVSVAVCFLWHFPWGHPRRALPGTVFPWSPDFPPPEAAAIRPADPLALGVNEELRQGLRASPCFISAVFQLQFST